MKYTEIERETTVNANTCQKIFIRWKENGTCANAYRKGTFKKINDYTIHHIKKYICTDREMHWVPL